MGNKELTAPESSWIYSHVMSSFFWNIAAFWHVPYMVMTLFPLSKKKKNSHMPKFAISVSRNRIHTSTAIHLISINTVHLDKNNKKQQKQAVELGVRWADSHIVMIKHKSGAACKAVSYIYGTIMSRLPKSYKWLDAIQGDKPLPGAR